MKHITALVIGSLFFATPLRAETAAPSASTLRTTGAVLVAQIEDSRLECSGDVSLGQLHGAVAKVLNEDGFKDSDAPEWRAAMAAALKQHAQFIAMTKALQAEFCANLVASGFIK